MLLGLATGISPAAAQAEKTPSSPGQAAAMPEPAWKLVCPQAPAPDAKAPSTPVPAPPCGLIQNLVAGEKKQRLLTLIVRRTGPGAHALTLALPHGLLFPPGVGLQVDEAPARTLAVQTSDQNGAYTGTVVDAALLAALRGGKTLKIGFTAGNGQRIVVPVTLKDFPAGLTALDKSPLPPAPRPAPAPAPASPAPR